MSERSRYEGTPYDLLRYLTLPIVAITTSAEGQRNGLIVNSAQRASLVPTIGRISMYISKPAFSHDLIYRSGVFGAHLLRTDQWDVIRALGLQSARDGRDKFEDLDIRTGVTGCPMLDDCAAAFECRVLNAMDAGAATFFLGEIVAYREEEIGPIMTSPYFRQHMPDDIRESYEANLAHAQEILEPLSRLVTPQPWPGAVTRP